MYCGHLNTVQVNQLLKATVLERKAWRQNKSKRKSLKKP